MCGACAQVHEKVTDAIVAIDGEQVCGTLALHAKCGQQPARWLKQGPAALGRAGPVTALGRLLCAHTSCYTGRHVSFCCTQVYNISLTNKLSNKEAESLAW